MLSQTLCPSRSTVWWWFQPPQLSGTITAPSVWSCLEVMVAKEPHSHQPPPSHSAEVGLEWSVVLLCWNHSPHYSVSHTVINCRVMSYWFSAFMTFLKESANNVPLQNHGPNVNHLSLPFFLHETEEVSVARVSEFWLLIIWLKRISGLERTLRDYPFQPLYFSWIKKKIKWLIGCHLAFKGHME